MLVEDQRETYRGRQKKLNTFMHRQFIRFCMTIYTKIIYEKPEAKVMNGHLIPPPTSPRPASSILPQLDSNFFSTLLTDQTLLPVSALFPHVKIKLKGKWFSHSGPHSRMKVVIVGLRTGFGRWRSVLNMVKITLKKLNKWSCNIKFL